jgi:hypothetical protein
MILEKLISMTCRIFFLGAFVLLGLAVLEKVVNATGYTIVRGYGTSRLLGAAAILVLFVIALELREMKQELKSRKP